MRLFVFGDKTFIRKFTGQEINGVEMTGISGIDELLKRLTDGKADIILVSGLKDDAGVSCELIKGSCRIPIALLVRENHTNWSQLGYFTVDGFIPEQASGDELKARLDAIWRRCVYYENEVKKPVL
jgi:DNA-binding NarL/FixJ family response regulator